MICVCYEPLSVLTTVFLVRIGNPIFVFLTETFQHLQRIVPSSVASCCRMTSIAKTFEEASVWKPAVRYAFRCSISIWVAVRIEMMDF